MHSRPHLLRHIITVTIITITTIITPITITAIITLITITVIIGIGISASRRDRPSLRSFPILRRIVRLVGARGSAKPLKILRAVKANFPESKLYEISPIRRWENQPQPSRAVHNLLIVQMPPADGPLDSGSAYDLVLLPNFLHHFDKETCVALLKKVRQSLKPDGKALAVELSRTKTAYPLICRRALPFSMLAHTSSGDAYTAAELDAMALAAGFKGSNTSLLANFPESLVTSRAKGLGGEHSLLERFYA